MATSRRDTQAESLSSADDDAVAVVARTWVDALALQLSESGRRVEGGWPGTLSEARRLMGSHLSGPTCSVTKSQFEAMVRAVYDDAKGLWLAAAKRDRIPMAE